MSKELPSTAYEVGIVDKKRRIELAKEKWQQTSLDDEPYGYVEALDEWELLTLNLRQFERRHNLGLI
jgi:hypothetical protein